MSEQNESTALATRQGNAIADASTAREVQEVQAMMTIAKRFPRDEKAALDRIINACTRKGLADSACYQYSRGGTDITGPSIRLAEAIAQNWGNLQFGVRELEQRNGESTVEAFAWDLETNTRQVKTFQVKHERHTKMGAKTLTDPRDIYELVANQGARRVRACILGVVPGDVVDVAVKQCDVTLNATAEVTPESIKKLVDVFAGFKVSKEQIEARIQRHIDAITPAQIVALRKIYNSLKDGMSKPADWFPVAADKGPLSKVKIPGDKKHPESAPVTEPVNQEAVADGAEPSPTDVPY